MFQKDHAEWKGVVNPFPSFQTKQEALQSFLELSALKTPLSQACPSSEPSDEHPGPRGLLDSCSRSPGPCQLGLHKHIQTL